MMLRVALVALLIGGCAAQVSELAVDYGEESDDTVVHDVTDTDDVADEMRGRSSPGIHSGCGVCNISQCAPTSGVCFGGYTLDACGCCPACSRLVGEYCNTETVDEMHQSSSTNMIWYGRCGNDLECVAQNAYVSGLLDGMPQQVKLCECKKRGKVCGNDGVTYPSICALKLAASARSHSGLQMRSTGTCSFGPIIVTKPTAITVRMQETSNVFMCEASGHPIPAILWTFTRADGTTVSIPSDDKDVSVITRGGQVENRVSSWVQIISVAKKHEGIYTCYAEVGGSRAVQEDAQLTVSQ